MKYIRLFEDYKWKPFIELITPSSDMVTHNFEIEIEAIVKGASDDKIGIKLNDRWVSEKFFTVNKGKVFCPALRLNPAENIIKIVAWNEHGSRDWSRKVFYEKLPFTKYTDEENTFVIREIAKIITEFHPEPYPFDSQKNIIYEKDGKILHTEYLNKWLNNRLFREVITKDFSLPKSPDKLVEFLIQNKLDIFHHKGIYFDKYYKIIEYTSMKGKKLEERSNKVFQEFAESKGMTCKYIKPTLTQDKKGIDSIFEINGKQYTVQIKPLSSVKSKTKDYIELVSAGDVRKIITNYLIVASDVSYFIIRVPLSKIDSTYKELEKTDDEIVDEIKLPDFETRDSDKAIRFSTAMLVYEKK